MDIDVTRNIIFVIKKQNVDEKEKTMRNEKKRKKKKGNKTKTEVKAIGGLPYTIKI